MNRIRLLPEQVANQIAAGEVVERPASVVKELVENALDAGATRVAVEVQAGGRSLIRITDDGAGMSRDDALLAFERHATSKIRRAEDLSAITSLGFRGEALPSIASVSRLTLTTRERDSEAIEATQVVIHGGKLLDVRSASGPPGTTIEVRQLFYNLPARRKFLRSEETERSHIQHYVTLAALSSPQVGFSLTQNQRTVWQLPPVPAGEDAAARMTALRERLRALHGAELNLIAVDHSEALSRPSGMPVGLDGEDDDDPAPAQSNLRIWGFIGAPGVSRATREDQHLFVNRRPIENRGLNFALLEGYHTALMKGRYPVGCLFLEIDPALVDVNIHPAKREVKFRGEREVRNAVAKAVRQALLAGANRDSSPDRSGPTNPVPSRPPTSPAPASTPQPPAFGPAPTNLSLDLDDDALARLRPRVLLPSSAPAASTPPPAKPPPPPVSPGESQTAKATVPPVMPAAPVSASPGGPAPLLEVPLRLVGVIGRLYVVLESDRGLVLMDQHAAHERVLFEQMLNRLEQGSAPCQRLLLPQTIEVSVRDADYLREALPALSRLGVGLSEFGERTFLLDGLPPFVRVRDTRQFVLDLLDGLKATGQSVNPLRLGEEMIAKTVCRHAVKANDPLQGHELEELVHDLRRCGMPYTCPHGRPTLIEFSYRELEKRFGRSA